MILTKKKLGQKVDKAIFPSNQDGPNQIIIAAKAQCFQEASLNDALETVEEKNKPENIAGWPNDAYHDFIKLIIPNGK